VSGLADGLAGLACVAFIALMLLMANGCGPSVYERANAVCAHQDARANTNALRRDHFLPPNGHVRCGHERTR